MMMRKMSEGDTTRPRLELTTYSHFLRSLTYFSIGDSSGTIYTRQVGAKPDHP